ncbi:uncharacterized protein LOC109603198 [Aethina tumida]|uniref:uncharacterized protein LOC109603198 n=1 Tax=Aethina tumida TaxID=116153 RepID=UPI002148BF76|nr:uncharacterized protein LOC109603198 [Aethina tumida]
MNSKKFLVILLLGASFAFPVDDRHRFFTDIGNSQYYIQDILKANWQTAFMLCRKHGLHLLSVDKQSQISLIEFLSQKEWKEKLFWTSGTDSLLTSWYWIDIGEPFEEVSTELEDDYNTDNHCLGVKGKTFYRANCNSTYHFICEYRIDPSSRYF